MKRIFEEKCSVVCRFVDITGKDQIMPNRIPVTSAMKFAKQHGLTHILIFAHDGKLDHIVTWGHTIEACVQTADYGNKLKDILGWNKNTHRQSTGIKILKTRLKESEEQRKKLVAKIQELNKENERLTHKLYQLEE